MSSIVENLKEIAGSLPEGVKLVAVSKTKWDAVGYQTSMPGNEDTFSTVWPAQC